MGTSWCAASESNGKKLDPHSPYVVLQHYNQKDYHEAIRDLDKVIVQCRKKKQKTKEEKQMWREANFQPPPNSVFEHGIVDFSPGWFAQRHEV